MSDTVEITCNGREALDVIINETLMPVSEDNRSDGRSAVFYKGPPSNNKTKGVIDLAVNYFKGTYTLIVGADCDGETFPFMLTHNKERGCIEQTLDESLMRCIEEASANPNRPHFLIIDEYPLMPTGSLKRTSPILDERTIGNWKLPDNVVIVLTGNNTNDSSGAGQGLAHLVRRKIILNSWYDVDAMFSYAERNEWDHDVMAFLKMFPNAWYCNQDTGTREEVALQLRDSARNSVAYPCSSGWEKVNSRIKFYKERKARLQALLVHNAEAKQHNDDVRAGRKQGEIRKLKRPIKAIEPSRALFAGLVGPKRAQEFMSLRGLEMPSNDDLIYNRAEFPEKPLAKWVAVIRAGQLLTAGNARATIGVLRNQSPEMLQVFFQVGGTTAIKIAKEQGNTTIRSKMRALLALPGLEEVLLADDSRYAKALEHDELVGGY